MTENLSANQEVTEELEREDNPLRDAKSIVAAFGGVRPMASRLNIAATTIQGWKSRGNIPKNRRRAVLEAAQADGLDLTIPLIADGSEEVPPRLAQEPVAEISVAPEQPRSIVFLAWLALTVAIIAAFGLLTFPQWSPLIHGIQNVEVPSDVADRLGALERQSKVPDLTGQVVALESAIEALQRRGSVAMQPDLTPQFRALSGRVEALTRTFETARIEGRAADDGSVATLSKLRGIVHELSQKVDQMIIERSSIIVTIGALGAAMGDGHPYGYALASVKRLATTNDLDYTESVATLQTHAATGIPTRSQLVRRLDTLIATRGKPIWEADSDSWTGRVLSKIDALISIRQVDEDSGLGRKLRQARNALSTNDLKEAAEALKGTGGPAGAWAYDATQRVVANQALSRLRRWSLKALDVDATEKTKAQ